MPTVKDIAEMAGISPSTVSIVLNGKAEQRQISRKTQDRVWTAARTLGYLPNISARSLRNTSDSSAFYILVFWAEDSRISMLVRFLRGVQRAISQFDSPCEILLNPYFNGKLSQTMTDRVMSLCHGAIVCNADESDMAFLHRESIKKPIVLYNRHSQKYSTVVVDDASIGVTAADIFYGRGRRCTAALTLNKGFGGRTGLRTVAFEQRCKELGISMKPIVAVDNSMQGGYRGALGLARPECEIDSVFCASDAIALGAIKGFHDANISVPGQVELISTGNGDQEQEMFAIPSLSVVNVPIDEMAEKCMRLLYKHLTYELNEACSVTLNPQYIPRESCPDA